MMFPEYYQRIKDDEDLILPYFIQSDSNGWMTSFKTISSGHIWYIPFVFENNQSFNNVVFYVSSTTAWSLSFAMYDTNSYGMPDNVLWTENVHTEGAGYSPPGAYIRSHQNSIYDKGIYWIAIKNSHTTNVQLKSVYADFGAFIYGNNGTANNTFRYQHINFYSNSGDISETFDPAPDVVYDSIGTIPLVMLTSTGLAKDAF